MYTLSSFRRRLISGDRSVEVELASGTTNWLAAQEHAGENTGETPTHVIFVELKESGPVDSGEPAPIGPSSG